MDRINRRNTNSEDENKLESFSSDVDFEGREKYEMDVDRMINEGLGGGYITHQNGLVDKFDGEQT